MNECRSAGDTDMKSTLSVKKTAESAYHFYYSREERLARRRQAEEKEPLKRRRSVMAGKILYVLLGAAIVLFMFLFLYKYFFH